MNCHLSIPAMGRMLLAFSSGLIFPGLVQALPFQGIQVCNCGPCIDYPQGLSSFADQVLRYDPLAGQGPAPTNPNFTNPSAALGFPDYIPCSSGNTTGSVSLGNGGVLEVVFVDNVLTNGSTAQTFPIYNDFDLWVYEVGGQTETMDIFVRPIPSTAPLLNPALDADLDGWFFIGQLSGQPVGIDLDLVFPGFAPGTLFFDAVRIVDFPNGGTSSTVGADIDAVAAISSASPQSILPYCFGIGCPCANDDPAAGCRNSTGTGALLTAIGSNSVTSDDLVLGVQGLPTPTRGFLYMGPAAAHSPFADGLRCVAPGPNQSPPGSGMLRFPIRLSNSGSFSEGPGIISYAQANFGAGGLILPGTTWHFQAHYRSPAGPCGSNSNLTNAVAVTFQ